MEKLRENARLPAVLDGDQHPCADQLRRAYLVDLRAGGYGSFSKTATWLWLPEVNGARS
jgi:hypothetical protein